MKTLELWLTLLLAAALVGCSSTGIEDSWVDPELKTLPRFERVFVAYMGGDMSAQRIAEDALAQHLGDTEVVKCYERYPDQQGFDPASLRAELRAAGCDGAVMLRLARVEQEVSFSPSTYPTHYRSFGGYWGSYPSAMDVRTDEIVHIETNVYSLVDDKLLYAARSKTFNPSSTAKLVNGIAEAVAKDMEKKGLSR